MQQNECVANIFQEKNIFLTKKSHIWSKKKKEIYTTTLLLVWNANVVIGE